MEMAHNAAAEKSGAAKYNHAQRHDAKLSRQLRLSILVVSNFPSYGTCACRPLLPEAAPLGSLRPQTYKAASDAAVSPRLRNAEGLSMTAIRKPRHSDPGQSFRALAISEE